MRNTARRSGSQYGRRRDEEYGRDEGDSNQVADHRQNTDSLIADMAKGFVEAQARITGGTDVGPNREMLAMLEKISSQLAQLQNASTAVQRPGGQEQAGPQAQGNSRQQGGQQTQRGGQKQAEQPTPGNGQGKEGQPELSAIFSQLLADGKNEGKKSAGNRQEDGAQQRAGGAQPDGGGQPQSGPDSDNKAEGQTAGENTSSAAQTAAQALARAQYELANELEASLAKLKQVIGESEKLADKISNLLGQENSSRQT